MNKANKICATFLFLSLAPFDINTILCVCVMLHSVFVHSNAGTVHSLLLQAKSFLFYCFDLRGSQFARTHLSSHHHISSQSNGSAKIIIRFHCIIVVLILIGRLKMEKEKMTEEN